MQRASQANSLSRCGFQQRAQKTREPKWARAFEINDWTKSIPVADDQQQVIDIHHAIASQVSGTLLAARTPAVDDSQQIIDVDMIIEVDIAGPGAEHANARRLD